MELSKPDQELLRNRLVKSSTEEDEDAKPLDPDSLVRKVWTERKEPSEDLLMPLLPYQKEGLGWMSSQEHSDVHGGILADEMGMGERVINMSHDHNCSSTLLHATLLFSSLLVIFGFDLSCPLSSSIDIFLTLSLDQLSTLWFSVPTPHIYPLILIIISSSALSSSSTFQYSSSPLLIIHQL